MGTDTTSDAPAAYPSEADLDAVLQEFDGIRRTALKAVLSASVALVDDRNESVSMGFVRGSRVRIIGRD